MRLINNNLMLLKYWENHFKIILVYNNKIITLILQNK